MKVYEVAEQELPVNPYISRVEAYLVENAQHRLEQLNPIDRAVIAAGFYDVEQRYGPDSDTPLKYHDQHHSWEAFEDYCTLAEVFELDEEEFVNGAIAIAWHDWEQLKGSGDNERESALKVQQVMDSAGYSINRQRQVANYVHATEVEFDESGRMTQKYLKAYGPDKALLAVTMADTYGITIHGTETMARSAYKLACEVGKVTLRAFVHDPSELLDKLAYQLNYVGTRLDLLEESVRYHMPEDDADRVLGELKQRFGTPSSRAIRAAKSVHELISAQPREAANAISQWAASAPDEKTFLAGIARRVTGLAMSRESAQSDK